MGMGGSIFFLVLGAILAFAVKIEPDWIDLEVTGWIFMIAGVVGVVLTGWFAKRKRRLHQEVHESYQNNRMARRQAVRRADAADDSRLNGRTTADPNGRRGSEESV